MSEAEAIKRRGERDSLEEVRALAAQLASRQVYFSVLDAFPSAAFILNGKRQVLYANKAALDSLGLELLTILGQRPGEMLNCEHVPGGARGCGTSSACRVCGILNAVEEAAASGRQTHREAFLTLGAGSNYRSLDLKVTATPLLDGGDKYLIIALEDNSDQKRKEYIERIFFHDVLNSLSVLKSSAELLLREPDERDYIDYIVRAASNLEEEILRQRDLRAMERGELEARPKSCSSLVFLHNLVVEYSLADFARDKTFILDSAGSTSLDFETDPTLLRRVLGNMFKNALEASPLGASVRAATREEGGEVLFEVVNGGFIPIDDQLRIFQRSFTTKGQGRGLGTYSMRVLTENYLHGRIGFESSPDQGTRFWIRLPLAFPA